LTATFDEPYTGQAMDKRYTGTNADVTYNLSRCIHAQYCVTRMAQVFDRSRRPWILADNAPTDALEDVILMCPSGALHIERKDGVTEPLPQTNTIRLWANGPLQFSGDLEINGAAVRIEQETRATLCRCGGSANKPFCDNAHKDNGFAAGDNPEPRIQSTGEQAGALKITALPNGPLRLEGPVEIRSADDSLLYHGTDVTLCRCGQSGQKPFCDGTHIQINFQAE
jgi:CDGSH-type Zn-finger protein/uncharacterized Fe-S cluster protein YjdI